MPNCLFHPHIQTELVCERCSAPICQECAVAYLKDRYLCISCIEELGPERLKTEYMEAATPKYATSIIFTLIIAAAYLVIWSQIPYFQKNALWRMIPAAPFGTVVGASLFAFSRGGRSLYLQIFGVILAITGIFSVDYYFLAGRLSHTFDVVNVFTRYFAAVPKHNFWDWPLILVGILESARYTAVKKVKSLAD
ncbi:MAG: hypothetical protein M1536_00495 [Firmicutes bacterium]|nr:hypothetical protein [Bacillota bacterium]